MTTKTQNFLQTIAYSIAAVALGWQRVVGLYTLHYILPIIWLLQYDNYDSKLTAVSFYKWELITTHMTIILK